MVRRGARGVAAAHLGVETEPLGIGSMTNLQHQRLVNLGCGRQWHPAWINFDTWAPDPRVRKHDLTKGIPLPDNSVDVVYHAHILEHFDRTGGLRFLRECFRVLNEGGIIRVVVPDLERIARLYLRALEQSINGSMEWQESYDWLMLEMYDQATRDYPGGGITDYFRGRTDPVPPFVVERMGRVPIERLMEALAATSGPQPSRPTFKKIFKRLSSVRTRAARAIVHGLLGEDDYRALSVGVFRQSGEVHRWMYDRYSLARSLNDTGFLDPHLCTATSSSIPGWRSYSLDADSEGAAHKPDSLYMEAVKDNTRK